MMTAHSNVHPCARNIGKLPEAELIYLMQKGKAIPLQAWTGP
jgi:hypothetical protein